jgi:biofilm protein TabA
VILDTLAHSDRYAALGPRIARGLAWLASFSPAFLDGRHEIDGENIFALVQSYDTVPPTEKRFESHRDYIDIQYVHAGREVILYAPLSELTPETGYDAARDFTLYRDPTVSTPLALAPGYFTLFYPHDGHKPGCLSGPPERIRKVVIKVRV